MAKSESDLHIIHMYSNFIHHQASKVYLLSAHFTRVLYARIVIKILRYSVSYSPLMACINTLHMCICFPPDQTVMLTCYMCYDVNICSWVSSVSPVWSAFQSLSPFHALTPLRSCPELAASLSTKTTTMSPLQHSKCTAT